MNTANTISPKTKLKIVLTLSAVILLTGLCMGVDDTTALEDHSARSEDYAVTSDSSAATANTSATTAYTYDSLNRLIGVRYADGSVIRYTYDAAGNRLIQTNH